MVVWLPPVDIGLHHLEQGTECRLRTQERLRPGGILVRRVDGRESGIVELRYQSAEIFEERRHVMEPLTMLVDERLQVGIVANGCHQLDLRPGEENLEGSDTEPLVVAAGDECRAKDVHEQVGGGCEVAHGDRNVVDGSASGHANPYGS